MGLKAKFNLVMLLALLVGLALAAACPGESRMMTPAATCCRKPRS